MEKISINVQKERSSNLLEKIVYILLVGLIFLLPLFFIPSAVISFAYSKVILLFLITLLSLFIWAIASFKSGELVLPYNWLSLAAIAIPVVFLLSSLFSPTKNLSLIGGGFELGTFSTIFLLTVLMFLVSIFV
ncbi:MAG TPA: hypothetical protein VFA52_00675 [Candidatus Paceibacterota bacterium]|nr:hypothetical protein [Candidatus Paceibacterota bacterium]